jgi:hypothetical protein
MNCILAVRLAIKITFECQRFAAALMFKDFDRLVERGPQTNAFCCFDGVA